MAERNNQRLKEVFPDLVSSDFFENMDSAVLSEIESELALIELSKGAFLFRQDDPGDGMYFLSRGMLEVSITQPGGDTLRLDVLDPGSTVGETALLTGQPRSAAVSAMVDSEVAQLSRTGFDRLTVKYPEAMDRFFQKILPRIQRTLLAAVLAQLFGPLETQVVHAIQRNITWLHLPAGEVLIRKGDPGDAMYIVINGRLRMVDDSTPGVERVIGDVARGETVGEFALLSGEPRSATVYALRDSDVVRLSGAYLELLVETYPKLLLQMTRSIVRRSQAQLKPEAYERTPVMVLAVVPSTPGLPLAQFSAQLASELSTAGKTLYLNSQRFDELFGRVGAAQLPMQHPTGAVINSWLTGSEQAHRFMIYEADAGLTEWTRRCLRQADRLVLVADTRAELSPLLVDPAFQAATRHLSTDLVLVHPENISRPVQTAAWLSRLAPRSLHHVRLGQKRDFSRLARRLTGRGKGLVLSGGGARGFAHLGAIQALEEAGHEFDMIGGTSMGALIGAAYAMDWNSARILEMVHTFASPGKVLDYTLPYTSLVSSYKAARILRELFGEIQIEDLWRCYYCLSTNLSRAEPLIHQTGSLWEAVRASTAIPGIFAPFLREGELLVDGGVLNNFPVDVMRERFEAGFIVGVNTSPKKEKARSYQYGPGVSGWQILWSKINPLAAKVRAPSILSSLMRATEASSMYRNSFLQDEADLLILPAVGEYSSLAFGEYEKIIEKGYQAARAKIASLSESNRQSAAVLAEKTQIGQVNDGH